MWIKICANTSADDALKAVEFGADAVGFVFAPSKRQVTAQQVRPISELLPDGVERVGVFAEASAEEIAAAVETARLTTVQLHGGFHHGRTERLEELLPGLSIIQTAHWSVDDDEVTIRSFTDQIAKIEGYAHGRRVLIDTRVGNQSGGTGISFDWNRAAKVLSNSHGLWVIMAGGLRPDTVAEAIRIVKPWGVDVASGVESEPGRKDFSKLRAFIENARRAVR
jgi:phosphoribosylanthranilate isomerase